MRILSVAEINARTAYRCRIGTPPPPPSPPSPSHDPILPQYYEDRAADEEVAAIMGSVQPINVAPLVMFAAYGSPQLLYPELGAISDNESVVDREEEGINEVWQVQEAGENAARIFARQAEVRAEIQEEEEEEGARVRLLREGEEDSEEGEEDGLVDAEEEEEEDSGVDSIDNDPEPMDEEVADSSSDSEADEPYDPTRDPEREARLHRLLGVHKHLWQLRQRLLRLKRRRDISRMEEKIKRARVRRQKYMAGLTRAERRNLPAPQVELPQKNRDFCYGCGRLFITQRVRWWWRCEMCGLWLCPDCNTDPLHCQRNELVQ